MKTKILITISGILILSIVSGKLGASICSSNFIRDTLPLPCDVVNITRLDGVGAGSNFLDMTDQTREIIISGAFDGTIEYKGSRAPFKVKVLDPSKIQAKTLELTLHDLNDNDDLLEEPISWTLTNVDDPAEVYFSDDDINMFKEQEIPELGISISIVQGLEPGNNIDGEGEPNNGIIGYEEVYTNPAGPKWLTGQRHEGQFPFYIISEDYPGDDLILDPDKAFANVGPGYFFPFASLEHRSAPQGQYLISPAEELMGSLLNSMLDIKELNNVDLVFTSDKSKWTRCPIVESSSRDIVTAYGFDNEGPRNKFELRDSPSVGKEDINLDGLPDPDGDGKGMGWFPGYAIDVETGERLNIFFGEASMYSCNNCLTMLDLFPNCDSVFQDPPLTGADMMWNPTDMKMLPLPNNSFDGFWRYIMGGQHYIYILNTPYDEGEYARRMLDPEFSNSFLRTKVLRDITWSGFVFPRQGKSLLSYSDGLIPNDLLIKLRVDNPFQYYEGTNIQQGRPTYRFTLENFYTKVEGPINEIGELKVIPNPLLADQNTLRVENLPENTFQVEIRDVQGKILQKNSTRTYVNGQIELERQLLPGTYLLVTKNRHQAPKICRFLVVN